MEDYADDSEHDGGKTIIKYMLKHIEHRAIFVLQVLKLKHVTEVRKS